LCVILELESHWKDSDKIPTIHLSTVTSVNKSVCLPVDLSATKLGHWTKFSRQTHYTLGSYNFLPLWPTKQLTLHTHLKWCAVCFLHNQILQTYGKYTSQTA